MLHTLCLLTVIEEIICPVIWKCTHSIPCNGWCWVLKKASKPKSLRREFVLTYKGLAPGIFTGKPVAWEACRYLEVLVATKQWVVKSIAATSYSSPSLRGTWLLKIIMHFCLEKWADSSTDSSSTSSAKILTDLWNLLWKITLFSRSLVWRTPPDLLENLAAVNQTDFQGWGTSKWNPRGVF